MSIGRRDVDGPVTGAADVGLASLLDALEGAFIHLVVVLAFRRADQLAEFIVEPFGAEIALLLGNPFLQAEMRFDHEFRHASLRSGAAIRAADFPLTAG